MRDERIDNNSEDVLATSTPGLPSAPLPLSEGSAPRPPTARGVWIRDAPFLQLAAYYLLLLTLVAALMYFFPSTRRAFLSPVALPAVAGDAGEIRELLQGGTPTGGGADARMVRMALDRAYATALAILGALALVIPVAAVYMRIKRLQYDPALVRSVVILPIVVAGIALVVKNSLALAFSLAGIVAAVRFRNTLKDPRDAVYIFLVIAIGLSAGVQALDVALVMSLIFNFVVLFLWRFNVGSVYGGQYGQTGVLAVGDPRLFLARSPVERKTIRRELLDGMQRMEPDGILLVHAREVEVARQMVQEALRESAADWRLARVAPRTEGFTTLEYLVEMKKEAGPIDLVGILDERWSAQIQAAEYVPFGVRERSRAQAEPANEEEGT